MSVYFSILKLIAIATATMTVNYTDRFDRESLFAGDGSFGELVRSTGVNGTAASKIESLEGFVRIENESLLIGPSDQRGDLGRFAYYLKQQQCGEQGFKLQFDALAMSLEREANLTLGEGFSVSWGPIETPNRNLMQYSLGLLISISIFINYFKNLIYIWITIFFFFFFVFLNNLFDERITNTKIIFSFLFSFFFFFFFS